MTRLRLAVAALVAVAIVPQARAQGHGRGVEQRSANGSVERGRAPAERVEVRIIHTYYAERGYKPKPLPPGIAKNLARGKQIPPGLRRNRLPDDLLVRLPRHDGHEWILANDVVLLVDVRGVVRDILRNVF